MVQRVTYRRRHSYNTTSNQVKVYVKLASWIGTSVSLCLLRHVTCMRADLFASQHQDSWWQLARSIRQEDRQRSQVR